MPEGESSAGIFYDRKSRKRRRRRRVILELDELGQVRRALRILRRVELFLVQQERHYKRIQKKGRARFLRESAKPHPIERVQNLLAELAEQG